MVWRTITITTLTCFLLGTTFTHWIVDHNVMWTNPITLEALERSIKYYSLLASSPDGLGWAYVAVGVTAILSAGGQLSTVLKGGDSEVLFDGGSAVLLAGVTYVQLSSVFPSVLIMPTRLSTKAGTQAAHPALESAARELASDNIMCAVMLTGVLFLQAGRYYSKRATLKERLQQTVKEESAKAQQSGDGPIRRTSTPFRELTEQEAMELKGLQELHDAEDQQARSAR